MPSPPTSRPRRILGALCLVLAVGLAAWLARDLPRKLVEVALAERLAAEVRLERLELHGTRHFVLAGLTLERIRDDPWVERLSIGELIVHGSPWDVLDGRFESLRLRGVEARLAPAAAAPARERPLPEIGELVLDPALLHLAAAGGGDSLLLAEATLREIGRRPSGRAYLRSPEVSLESLFALSAASPPVTGRLRDLRAALELGGQSRGLTVRAAGASLSLGGRGLELSEPRWTADLAGPTTTHEIAAADAAWTAAGSTAPLREPRLSATVARVEGDRGLVRVAVRPLLPGLEDGSLDAEWDGAERRLQRLDARLRGVDLERLLPGLGVEAEADLELRGAGDRLDYDLRMTPRRVDSAAAAVEAGGASTLEVRGHLPFEPLSRLGTPDWLGPVEATLHLDTARGRWGSVSVPTSLFPATLRFAGRWLGGRPLRLAGRADVATAVGELVAEGEITLDGSTDLGWRLGEVRLEDLTALLRREGALVPAFPVAGVAAATGRLNGPPSRPQIRGEIRLRDVEAAGGGDDPAWRLDGAALTAGVAWAGPGAPIRLRDVSATGTLATRGLRDLPLELRATGWLDPRGLRGGLDAAVLESPGLGTARWTADGRQRPDGRFAADGRLVLEDLSLAAWQRAARPLSGSAALADFDLAGTARAELEVAADGDGDWQLEGPVELTAAGFASRDGSRVMEGLEGRWQLAAAGAAAAPVEARLDGSAGGFLLLWNTFFGDFSTIRATLDAGARLEPAAGAGGRGWRLHGRARVPEGPTVEATLERSAGGRGLRYDLRGEDPDLAATHRRYLSALLADSLGGLELGGRLAAKARGSYRDAAGGVPAIWSLLGDLNLEDFLLESGGGQAAVEGVHLELPLELRRRASPGAELTGPRLTGRLAFERLALRGLELPATRTDLWVEADAVGFENPVALRVLGGRLTLGGLSLRRLLRPDRHLETAIGVEGVRLDRVAEELGLFPLEGALDGDFPRVRLSPDRLRVEGGGRVEVFGGVVEVRDISGEDVFTRFPKLSLSADFHDLDLGALTRRLDFGEMTGRLEGSLEDCELFGGVPVRFSARLATVETKGVPRTVDVKAIENLAILGTGAGTGVFDRGLRKLFQRYRYAALGATLRLDDDRLLMRGLERRGDKELFLRGRFPFRIDVVNAQPGKTVSFQAMVRRLKSLDVAAAGTGPEG